MIPTIINQLNNIRFLEQQKLLYQLQTILQTNKKPVKIRVPDDLFKNLTILQDELYPDNNLEIDAENYRKFINLLSFTVRKQKNISQKLRTTGENMNEQPEIEKTISAVQEDLEEINRKIKYSLPENFDLKPLDPFIFLNKEAAVTQGMVSIIIINDNGSDNLVNLFESFIRFNTYKNFKFIVVDQHSTDHSLETIKSYQDKLPVEIIIPPSRSTSAYLNNLGADANSSEFLLFISNKVILESDALAQFADIFNSDPSCGIAGASLAWTDPANGEESQGLYGGVKFKIHEIRGVPDIPFPLFDPGFLLNSGIKTSVRDYRGHQRTYISPGINFSCLKPYPAIYDSGSGIEQVPGLSGSLFFCRRIDFFKAGGFDLNYCNGYELIDLCLKFANRLFKMSFLAHDILAGFKSEQINSDFNPEDETISNYNLGVLINRHGYYLKDKYLKSLIRNEQYWTDDRIENPGVFDKFVSRLNPTIKINNEGNLEITKENILDGYLSVYQVNRLRIAIKIPPFDDDKAKHWGDYHFAQSLKAAFWRRGFAARVDLYDYWYDKGYMNDDVVIVLRGIKNYHPRGSQINIIWNISHPEHIDKEEYLGYDHVFVASEVFARDLMENFGIKAEELQQCTDPLLFFPDKSPTREEEINDILYIANSRNVMRKSIAYTMQKQIQVAIYGTNWETLIPPEMITGSFIPNDKLRRYYSNCRILLNDHWKDMADEGYISNRIFDALACGAVILTDKVKGIDEVFPEGLFYYDTPDEMEEQIQWIREHYEEAKALAMKNSLEVLEKHTFDHRAERILEVALQIHQRKTIFEPPPPPVEIKKPGLFGRWFNFSSKEEKK